MNKYLFFWFSFLFIFYDITFAFNFSPLRENLLYQVKSNNVSSSSIRMMIIFVSEKTDRIKRSVDMIKMKKQLAYEMLKSFDVVDPIIVQKMLLSNRLNHNRLKSDSLIAEQFLKQANSTHLFFVYSSLVDTKVDIKAELMDRSLQTIALVQTALLAEKPVLVSQQPQPSIPAEPVPSSEPYFASSFDSIIFSLSFSIK